jgi:hypothetical protein
MFLLVVVLSNKFDKHRYERKLNRGEYLILLNEIKDVFLFRVQQSQDMTMKFKSALTCKILYFNLSVNI